VIALGVDAGGLFKDFLRTKFDAKAAAFASFGDYEYLAPREALGNAI